MIKEKYSLQQICKRETASQKSNLLVSSKKEAFVCPKCNQKTFFINKEYKIGYCSNEECNIFVDFKPRINKNILSLNEQGLKNIVDEAENHLTEKMAIQELDSYYLSDKICTKYHVGYYPSGYWVNAYEDYQYGNMIFPLYNWNGEITNVCAKYIGSPEKIVPHNIHFAKNKVFGAFNPRGIWNEEVNLFLDPMDCLVALQGGLASSFFLNKINFPKVITFNRLNIFGKDEQNVIIKEIENKLDKKIEINFYSPSNLNSSTIFNYLVQK